MEIQADVAVEISESVFIQWFKENTKTSYKIEVFIDVYKKLFIKNNINWVCGLLFASKLSNNFSSEFMNNHNPFGVTQSVGDKGEELIHFSSLGQGITDGVKYKVLKLKSWPNDIVEKYNSILKSVGSEPIVIPVDLPIPKNEDKPQNKPIKKKNSFMKSIVFFLTGVTIILGMLSFFIPVLAPIATIIKGILSLINVIYGGN